MTLLPQPEPDPPVEGMPGHFEHTNWVVAAIKALDTALGGENTGGSISGDITINPPGEDASLYLQGSGHTAVIGLSTGGLRRWRLSFGDNVAETGGDTGAKFQLSSYSDAGVLKTIALVGDRVSGLLTVAGDPTSSLGIATKQYVDNSMPIGIVVPYMGNTAPPGWHLCNGTAHGSAALQAISGSPNTVDLSDRFIVGVGPNHSRGATGGSRRVQLTAAQSGLPSHSHSAGSGSTATNHSHTASTGDSGNHRHGQYTGWMTQNWSHSHGAHTYEGLTTGDSNKWIDTADEASPATTRNGTVTILATDTNHQHEIGWDGNHSHSVTVNTTNQSHSHTVTVDAVAAANAAETHENEPPWYAMVYIVKKA
jgi:microcystin-dependent protein